MRCKKSKLHLNIETFSTDVFVINAKRGFLLVCDLHTFFVHFLKNFFRRSILVWGLASVPGAQKVHGSNPNTAIIFWAKLFLKGIKEALHCAKSNGSLAVVYFDQKTGSPHAIRWLKSIFKRSNNFFRH